MLGAVPTPPPVAAAAYRAWIRGGRLVGLPAKRSRRLPLLDLLAQEFHPGETYDAAEVDRALRRWHPDTALLRRLLVDEGFLDRLPDGSSWWRCGGTVDLDVAAVLAAAGVDAGPGGGGRPPAADRTSPPRS